MTANLDKDIDKDKIMIIKGKRTISGTRLTD